MAKVTLVTCSVNLTGKRDRVGHGECDRLLQSIFVSGKDIQGQKSNLVSVDKCHKCLPLEIGYLCFDHPNGQGALVFHSYFLR